MDLNVLITTSFNEVKSLIYVYQNYINDICRHLEPLQIIFYSVFITVTSIWLKNKIFNPDVGGLTYKQLLYRKIRQLPGIKQTVQKRLASVSSDIEKEFQKGLENRNYLEEIPESGWPKEKILEELNSYMTIGNYDWNKGFVSGTVYHGKDETLLSLVKEVYGRTAYHNPLHPDVFPGIRIMEAEIVKMVCSLFHGDENCCGNVTTGGTESIFLACKAYRDYARFERGIKYPNIVIPVTAHAAFDKAAQILKIEVRHVNVYPKTMKVKVSEMKRAIDKNTCMLMGSTPAFPHGAIDPIGEITKLGLRYNIPVHVDACLGGFLIAFMNTAGFDMPPFDFSVPGVTSMSADTHKYAYAPKGTSVILYCNKNYHHYQYSVQPDWPGGIYGTPNLPGSRSGGLIATCWASLLYHGFDFYVEATSKIIKTTRHLANELQKLEEIHLIGTPDVSVIAVGSDHFNIYQLCHLLTEKGWNVNILQYPPGFHFCVTLQHTEENIIQRFLLDIKAGIEIAKKSSNQEMKGAAAVYGTAQMIPDRTLVSEIVWEYLDGCTSCKKCK